MHALRWNASKSKNSSHGCHLADRSFEMKLASPCLKNIALFSVMAETRKTAAHNCIAVCLELK